MKKLICLLFGHSNAFYSVQYTHNACMLLKEPNSCQANLTYQYCSHCHILLHELLH